MGVSEEKLDVLNSWRELSGYFSAEEYAASELAEDVTLLPSDRRAADAAVRAGEVFTEKQVAAIEWATIVINTFHRISIASGHGPVPRS